MRDQWVEEPTRSTAAQSTNVRFTVAVGLGVGMSVANLDPAIIGILVLSAVDIVTIRLVGLSDIIWATVGLVYLSNINSGGCGYGHHEGWRS